MGRDHHRLERREVAVLCPYHEVLVHALLSRVPFIEPSSEVMTASTLGLADKGDLFHLRWGPGSWR